MTPLREALLLPGLFLTVVLLGALRPGGAIPLVPPSLASLVAAMALFALLVQSGSVDPARLMHRDRSSLANLNGLTVLVTAFVASAQMITLVVPESGVPALVVWAVLLALLGQALAMAPDRTRLLRGLLVTFGAAFLLKFVLLASLSAPADGRLSRVLQLLFDGVTLGTVTQRMPHPAEGYLAFTTLLLYLAAVSGLPAAAWHVVRVERHPPLAGDIGELPAIDTGAPGEGTARLPRGRH